MNSVNKKYRKCKGLIFQNRQPPVQKKSDNYTIPGANINQLSSNMINTNKLSANMINTNGIISKNASISGIDFETDGKITNINIIPEDGLVIKAGNSTIHIGPNGEIDFDKSISAKMINAVDAKMSGDIEADNLNLLGLIEANGAHFGGIDVDGNISTNHLKSVTSESLSTRTKSFIAIDGVYDDKLLVTNNLTVGANIETPQLSSPFDLLLTVPLGNTINVPNIRYNIDVSNITIIDPPAIKFSKIFVVTRNIVLAADSTCNGIEIIIYNNSKVKIKINDKNIITEIAPFCSKKMVYIHPILKWIIT